MNLMKVFSIFFIGAALSLTACNKENATEAKADVNASTTSTPQNTMTDATANKAEEVPTGPLTTVQFEEMEHDFGIITDGDKVRHAFKFTNTGKEPLIISNCKGSCGCTVPECPKTPIAPGATGEITVEYNSRGKSKGQPEGKLDSKFVNITANTEPNVTRLTIKATVKGDPNAEENPS